MPTRVPLVELQFCAARFLGLEGAAPTLLELLDDPALAPRSNKRLARAIQAVLQVAAADAQRAAPAVQTAEVRVAQANVGNTAALAVRARKPLDLTRAVLQRGASIGKLSPRFVLDLPAAI